MYLKDIYGQDSVKNKILNIMNTNVGHAYVFEGQDGIGKKTISKAFTALLLCENVTNNEVCGECKSCNLIHKETMVDYYEVMPSKFTISVDEIRKMQENINIRPLYSKRKVYLIYDAHNMTVQAQNCLLKTLEEPPQYVTIILNTSNYDALQETIKSRIVKINVEKYSDKMIKKFITDNYVKSESEIEFITSLSEGIIGKSKIILESNIFLHERDKTLDLFFESNTIENILNKIKYMIDNKDKIKFVVKILITILRDILLIKCNADYKFIINKDRMEIIKGKSENYTFTDIVRKLEILENIYVEVNRNANLSIAMDNMFLRLQED